MSAKNKKKSRLYKFLLYMTNNELTTRHEIQFDIFFFVVGTITLVAGLWYLISKREFEWIPFLILEYFWFLDNARNNREYVK